MRFVGMCFLFSLFACVSGCGADENAVFYKKVEAKALQCCDTARHLIHSGDLITRTGNDLSSSWLRKLNTKDQTYSHTGIASIENGILYVYHAVGGESNPAQCVRRDRLSSFVNGYDNAGFGIFRFDFPKDKIAAFVHQAQYYYRRRIPFDMSFDLQTDDKMYCTEMVAKSAERAWGNQQIFRRDTLSGKAYIAPDAIFLHPHCHEIKRLRYF